jgi:glutathione synthase/RimK-type ligase-like ATP-grasp enzyme
MSKQKGPIAVYHEHQEWFRPLFRELEARGTPFLRIDARSHHFDPSSREQDFALLFNRVSPSAYTRGNTQGIFYTLYYLAHLERVGTRVVNGRQAFITETSKALQLSLLESLGLPYPRARVINHPGQAAIAAHGLRFPVMVKPNLGGSGAGVSRYDTPEDLLRASAEGGLQLGIDHTALVQEFIPARGGHISRVEVLGGKYLYAIRVFFAGDDYNLCPGDICQTTGGEQLERAICATDAHRTGMKVEAFQPPAEVIAAVERIMHAAGIEVGGVEYIVDDRDGRLLYYDINALSNFVADGPRVVGFDPYARLADFLENELAQNLGKEAAA